MTYPLLFPNGERGWSPNCLHTFGNRRVTLLQFYAYRLSARYGFNTLLSAGKLTQQYIVDAYVKVEGSRLRYIKENQRGLRVELYSGLMDHIKNLASTRDVHPGKIFILPSSFQGGARCMQQRYQNAMAVVRKYGKPCLLLTFNRNPLWSEITRNIELYQRASDRPDIVARVFYVKLQSLICDLTKRHVLGVPAAMVHVVEFQKRGLPHAHILLTLRQEDKIRNADDADKIVCSFT